MQMLYAFLDGQPVDIFAFLVVFTGVAFYTHYVIPPQFIQFGYSAVADQTVAGAFLLIPGLVDLVVMSPLFFRWLAQIEQQRAQDVQKLVPAFQTLYSSLSDQQKKTADQIFRNYAANTLARHQAAER